MVETIISEVLEGKATRDDLAIVDDEVLDALAGRWDLTAGADSKLAGDVWQVTLRIEGTAVSGDVFQPVEQRRSRMPMRLGGRDDWRFSFWGKVDKAVVTKDHRWLVAICDASHRFTSPTAARPRAILSLRDAGGGRPAIRLSLLWDQGGTGALGPVSERTAQAPEGAKASTAMRRVLLKYVVATTEGDREAQELRSRQILRGLFLDRLDGGFSSDWTIEECMRREGIELVVAPGESSPGRRRPRLVALDSTPDAALEDILAGVAQAPRGPDVEPYDWTLVLVLSGDRPQHGPGNGTQILGRAYGLSDGQNRFRTRFGAIVHVARFEEEIADFRQDGAETDLSDEELLRRLICHYTMHELGHLLNLPHCWERDMGFRMLGDAVPAAPSYTNYPGNWPFGPVAGAHFSSQTAEVSGPKRRLQRLRYFKDVGFTCDVRATGFDDAERFFLRHAPFDQIAQGGRTFLDDTLPAPALLRPTGEDTDHVEIGCRDATGFRRVDEIRLWHWISPDLSEICFPPVPALVRSVGSSMAAPLDFRFENSALQLLIRGESGSPLPYASARTTIVLDPSQSLDLNVEHGKSRDEVLLPWFAFDEAMTLFERGTNVFSMQVVYYKNSQTIQASNIVIVSYEEPREYPASPEAFGRLLRAKVNVMDLRPHFAGAAPTAIVATDQAATQFTIEDPFVQ